MVSLSLPGTAELDYYRILLYNLAVIGLIAQFMILRTVISFLPKTRSSHPISKLLRPALEVKRLKFALGGALSAAGVFFGSFGLMAGSYKTPSRIQAFSPPVNMVVIETKKQDRFYSFKRVLPGMNGISQGFGRWHSGVDITAPAGSKIYSIGEGRVIKIGNSSWGYGRSILIKHNDGFVSLYAHLGKIMVEEGDVVEKKTVLAEVGLTGRTTGYHLHLEVRSNDKAVNPVGFLIRNVRLANKI